MKIVKVDPREYHYQIDQLGAHCFPECGLLDLSGHWWLAKDNDFVHGFAALQDYVREARTGYLYRAGVHVSARGQGLQRKFLAIREVAAKRMGWRHLVTDTSPTNTHSQRNIIAAGYLPYRPEIAWSGEEWLYWRKEL